MPSNKQVSLVIFSCASKGGVYTKEIAVFLLCRFKLGVRNGERRN